MILSAALTKGFVDPLTFNISSQLQFSIHFSCLAVFQATPLTLVVGFPVKEGLLTEGVISQIENALRFRAL